MFLDFYQDLGIIDGASEFSKILLIINFIFSLIIPIIYLSQNIFSLIGLLFKPKKYVESEKKHKFAYIVCAHNEESVIDKLIDSIHKLFI